MGAAWRGLVALWPRIAITLICLAFWRILAAIPLPVAGLVDLRLSSGRLVADGGLLVLLLGNPLEQESVVALGLNSFLDAFIIFWLWAASTGNLEKVHRDQRWMWRTLAWLTAGLALARAFGLVLRHHVAVRAGPRDRSIRRARGLWRLVPVRRTNPAAGSASRCQLGCHGSWRLGPTDDRRHLRGDFGRSSRLGGPGIRGGAQGAYA